MIKAYINKMAQWGWSSRIRDSRATMREAFKRDAHFKHGYVSNIAMLFYDRYGKGNYITNHTKRNEAAEAILDLIFKEEG